MIECTCENQEDIEMFECMDCHCCTKCNDEYYMVHDEVWESAVPEGQGMLCIGCLEERLGGRRLTRYDFGPAPVNSMSLVYGSKRLKNRLLSTV